MNNYWNIKCSNCGLHLRLTVEEKDFGRTVKANCPKCGAQTRTTIDVPVSEEDFQISPKLGQKMAELVEKITTNSEIASIIDAIRDEGFGVLLAMGVYKMKSNEETRLSSKVDKDGKVKVGTFTKEDEEDFKKYFKIKL